MPIKALPNKDLAVIRVVDVSVMAQREFVADQGNRRAASTKASLKAVATSLVGFLAVWSFYVNMILPVQVGIILILGLGSWALLDIQVSRYSVYPRLMILIYAIPFATLLPYLWDPRYEWAVTRRGLRYSSDALLLGQMVAIGTVGLLGLICGMYLALAVKPKKRWLPSGALAERERRLWRTLSPTAYVILLVGAWSLSWFSAPTKNIFAAAYFSAGTQAQAEDLNFNAAYLASYVVLVLLFVDAEREIGDTHRRRLKYAALTVTILAIVIYLQILRGNRESSGLIAALVGLYVTGPGRKSLRPESATKTRRRVMRIAVPVVIAGLAFITLGSARHTLSDPSAGGFNLTEQLSAGWQESTWKGVLLTNLSIAAQHRYGTLEYIKGQSYTDVILSLPPGPIMAVLGLERPLERGRGPAEWTKGVSAGGAHIVIVPFKNFGIAGAFVVMCAYGYFIVRLERLNDPRSLWGRLLYGSALTTSFLWFWLGDITMVRAFMVAGLVGFGYRAACRTRWLADPRPGEAAASGLRVPTV